MTFNVGFNLSICALLLFEEVAIIEFGFISWKGVLLIERNESLWSDRLNIAALINFGVLWTGKSFKLWTAISIEPFIRLSWISLTKYPLSIDDSRGSFKNLSPFVTIFFKSNE